MEAVLVGLPAAALVVLLRAGPSGTGWRERVMVVAPVWGAALAAITEVLSGFGALTAPGVAAGWLVVAGAVLLARPARCGEVRVDAPRAAGVGWTPSRVAMIGAVATLVGAVGVVAVMAAPQTGDSMTYHLGRVVHWAQNASVVHYPTAIERQLYQPPWAEFAILHLQLLSGGDRLANLVQWGALAGSLVGVSLITRRLGGSPLQQLVAVAVAASLPMILVQASSTQNDLVVAFWLVCLVYWAGVWSRSTEDGHGGLPALAMGATLGLALLTKGTAYLFAPPVVAWAVLRRWRATGHLPWRPLVVVVLVGAALSLPHHDRNQQWYGKPLGPGSEWGGYRYSNDSMGPARLVSVAVRNVGLHIGTPSANVNAVLERWIERLHAALGLNLNDSATTWPGTTLKIEPPRYHEDFAGNGLHLILILTASVVLVIDRRRRPEALAYAAVLGVAFLLFCAVLRWQPWHSRLQLPLFVLAAPLVALALAPGRLLASLIGVGLCLAAWPWILFNESRPLLGRASIFRTSRVQQHFSHHPALRDPYTRAASFVGRLGCGEVGVVLGSDDWEYPLWVLLRRAMPPPRPLHIEHAHVRGAASPHTWRSARGRPCALIVTRPLASYIVSYRGQRYEARLATPEISVFLPAAPADEDISSAFRPPPGHEAGAVKLSVAPNQVTPGMTVTIGVDAWTLAGGSDVELVVGILGPDRRTIRVLAGDGGMGGIHSASPRAALPPTRTLRAGERLSAPAMARITVPEGVAPGTYEIVALLIVRDEDGEPGRRVATDKKSVTVAPASR